MKSEPTNFWTNINQGLIGRSICCEITQPKIIVHATISEIRLKDGLLIIKISGAYKKQGAETTLSPFGCNEFVGNINGVTDPTKTPSGQIIFHNWGGYDSIKIM